MRKNPIICKDSILEEPEIQEDNDGDDGDDRLLKQSSLYENEVMNGGASIMEFELLEHKPLGCTAEESSAPEDDGTKPVFIAKVS